MIKKDGVYKVLGYEFTEVESVNAQANHVENPIRVTSVEVDIEANDNLNNRFMVEKLGMFLYRESYNVDFSEHTFILCMNNTTYRLTLSNKKNN